MSFELPDLPYAKDALEPYISERTLKHHYEDHHAGYVKKLNKLVEGSEYADMTLLDIVRKTLDGKGMSDIHNNAAQIWNHTFFWNGMCAGGGGAPSGVLAEKINRDLGGMDKFCATFRDKAAGQFGSGWVWLTEKNDSLHILATANARIPLSDGHKPLLTCDVWEHAYYLDYQARRTDFVDAFAGHLINWEFVQKNLHGD